MFPCFCTCSLTHPLNFANSLSIFLHTRLRSEPMHATVVLPGFLVQFGISYSTDKELKKFARQTIPDDPHRPDLRQVKNNKRVPVSMYSFFVQLIRLLYQNTGTTFYLLCRFVILFIRHVLQIIIFQISIFSFVPG